MRGARGEEYFYCSNDNFKPQVKKELSIKEILELAQKRGLVFNKISGEGAVFHLLSAWSDYKKFGYTIIAKNKTRINELHHGIESLFS